MLDVLPDRALMGGDLARELRVGDRQAVPGGRSSGSRGRGHRAIRPWHAGAAATPSPVRVYPCGASCQTTAWRGSDGLCPVYHQPMTDERPYSPGLEGVIAAESAIGLVDGQNGRLLYRGYPIGQL